MRYLSVGPCCRAPLLAICCCCRLGRGRCLPGVDHGSSGHKVTARWTASWITELTGAARGQRVTPKPAVPLALGPAGAGFAENQILVVVAVINRPRPKGAGPGPRAIARQDPPP